MKWRSATPKDCELCLTPLEFQDSAHSNPATGNRTFIDGQTRASSRMHGAWAIMCVPCHVRDGNGLGDGRGQRYDLETLEKIDG